MRRLPPLRNRAFDTPRLLTYAGDPMVPRMIFAFSLALLAGCIAGAQPTTPSAPGGAPPASTPPPRNPPLQERTWEQLPQQSVSMTGSNALAIKKEQWKHAETENFILHFRRVGDANAVAAEVEFDLWFVARELGASKEQYARKSHVYIFKDEREWQKFLEQTNQPKWFQSFAMRDELFLNVAAGGGAIDSESLAHETTHAVVARLYGHRRWPLWLSEGFAEYMGRASVATRHSRSLRRNQDALLSARLTVAELTATSRYPTVRTEVHQLYESAEKLVRYLCNKYPKELFPRFVDRILAGETATAALVAIYGAEFQDMASFERKFARFTR